jgi:hypothetical protein
MFQVLVSLVALTAAPPDSSFRRGDRIYVEPVGVSFALPRYWVDSAFRTAAPRTGCGGKTPGTIYTGLDGNRGFLANAIGEWDREFSAVADSVLPLMQVVLHVGAEPWGAASSCYGDLQARVYVVDLSVDEVTRRVKDTGTSTARRFFEATASIADSSGWRIARLRWDAFYHDYGSTTHMDYYIRNYGRRAVVLLFMDADRYGGPTSDRSEILASWR